ncbi:hypothetical protein [Candidatus Protofrankia californiensis]|uniref:hypothetical protein n=1 Tax=Candidatus Protofrankia californiensis TaxID=1839754 RepID=UPI0010416CEC|nr:hypothetical protein [Candidatus Protofrankia californiensis]
MATPNLTSTTMKRLAFIRLMYQQGVDQSHLPEPLMYTSVLTFHDAVEWFLLLSGEHLGASVSGNTEFKKYWTELSPAKCANGVVLTGQVGMRRLNDWRNGFKHAGALPGRDHVEQARASVTTFFEENTPTVFGVLFDGIDMADLVPQTSTRQKIKMATASNTTGDRAEAMALLVEAFDELFDSRIYPNGARPTPFSFGPTIRYALREQEIVQTVRQPDSSGLPPGNPRRLGEQIREITDVTMAVQNAMRVVALGISYAEYRRFLDLTPRVWVNIKNESIRNFPQGYAPNQEEFDYCQRFVVTVALRLAELNAHTVPPSWKTT